MNKHLFFFLLLLVSTLWGYAQNCGNGVTPCSVSLSQWNGPTVYTSNGNPVNTLSSAPLAPCEVSAGDTEFNSFSNITNKGCPTSSYNCHGYAWHKVFQGTEAWIETNEISKYLNDYSFYEVPSAPSDVKTVVVYSNNNHSAITVPGSTKYISKWGAGYLVEHEPTNVPAGYGTPDKYYIRCGECLAAPDMYQISYNYGSASTVNFVSPGGYNIYTNIPHCHVNSDISWSATGTGSWGTSGPRKVNGWVNLSSGQSNTFLISAPSTRGTNNRYVTFVAQSGYRMYSTNGIKDKLTIEFDNLDYLEILPQTIAIFDEQTGKEELNVSIKEIFDNKGFLDNKISIDVKKLPRGLKIVNLMYLKLDTKEAQENVKNGLLNQFERKTERIILID